MNAAAEKKIYDCIVVGAGPGGLQGALHLARFNRSVLLLDRGGGRTTHARYMVNYLGYSHISGRELIEIGFAQVKSFGVDVVGTTVTEVRKQRSFSVQTAEQEYESRYIICASGARESIPHIKNLGRFFAESVFTCVTCDGYLTTGRKLVILGNSAESVRLALGMKLMYTKNIVLVLTDFQPSEADVDILADENIRLVSGEVERMLGENHLTGVQLRDSTVIEAQAVILSLGASLNDSYLKTLGLKRNQTEGKYLVNSQFESSLDGLYLTGSLCQGHAQAIIAAGQGAVAAIDINQKLLQL